MKNPNLLQLFIYCLLKANHKPNEFIFGGELVKVERGSFISGRFEIAKALNMNPSSVYKNLKKLQLLGYISLNSNNKNTMLTICKYDTYQMTVTTKEQQSNNKVTTKEQQSNTNKNDNNEENDNNEKEKSFAVEKTQPLDVDFIEDIISLFKITYRSFKNVEYISVGKKGKSNYQDRNAVGSLLKYIKAKYPGEDSEMTLNRFQSLFKNCFLIKETWLQNNMTLPIIFSKLNNIILYGNNGNKEPGITNKPKFDPNEFVREFSKQHG